MSEDCYTVTRKLTLRPVYSDNKQYVSKLMKFIENSYEEKIAFYEEKVGKEKGEAKKKAKARLETLRKEQEEFKESGEITNQHVTDYGYTLVREAAKSESRRKNAIISYVICELINREAQKMEFKERNKLISELANFGYRVKGSKKGSLFDLLDIENMLGGYGVGFNQDLTKKIKEMVNSKGVLDGRCSIITYKDDSPFTVVKAIMGFEHEFETLDELHEKIFEKDTNLYFNLGSNGNPTIARFKIDLGSSRHRNNKHEIIATLFKMYAGEYKYCGSSMQIEKNKIILNLTLQIPKHKRELDEDTVVGVDLGVAVPAMCALNNNKYERLAIGDSNDFLRVRTQLQSQRRRLQKQLQNTTGGHGRKKKLQALDRISEREKNFVNTYCHMISKRVVDFALKHNAKYINLENLAGYDTSEFILRNWSFYKLQQDIIYKAEKYGIVVRFVNPCYTSQVCSVCGHWEPNQRKTQSQFECFNSGCASHKMYKNGFNADFNASRNISMSTLFMSGSEKITEKHKEEARKYYGIEFNVEIA